MAFLTNKEFAAKANMSTRQLSVYVSRRKVVAGDDGFFDTENEFNSAFLIREEAKKNRKPSQKVPDVKVESKKRPDISAKLPKEKPLKVLGKDIMPWDEADRIQKHLNTEKTEHEIALLRLKQEKMNGQLVPAALMKPAILQHNKSMVAAFKNGGEELIRQIGKIKGLTNTEIAQLRGMLTVIINEAQKNATDATVKALHGVVSEFSQTRGVGERA